jgi:hypothetical protein
MADQIYKVRDPSGNIREIRGPAGASDEEIIARAKLLFGTPQAAPAPAPAAAQAAAPTGLQQFGRAAASLADVAIGAIPAAVGQIAYPFYRAMMPAEQAQRAAQAVLPGLQQPIGRAFGVTETPEYKGEASRQVLDFVGANIGKGIKWISEQLGMPEADVASMAATLSVGVPGAARTVSGATRAGLQQARIGAEMAVAPGRAERLSAAGYARGPQIEAAAEAQRLGLSVPPSQIQPSLAVRAQERIAGEQLSPKLSAANVNQVRKVALRELDLPENTQLNIPKKGAPDPFDQARAKLAKPYDEVKQLPIQLADNALTQRLQAIRADMDVIGAREYAPAISKIVDDAIAKTGAGVTGEQLLKNIQVLRQRAKKTYDSKSASIEALDIADTNLKIATELESMIDSSIADPRLLQRFRDARQKMARTYAYEAATDRNTGRVDVLKIARQTAKDNNLTGDIAAMGRIAGNFPEAFQRVSAMPEGTTTISRSGALGAGGAVLGAPGGIRGSILGGIAGGVSERIGARALARRLASPEYQRGLEMYDPRVPVSVNQLAQQVASQNALRAAPQPEWTYSKYQNPYEPPVIVLNNLASGRP